MNENIEKVGQIIEKIFKDSLQETRYPYGLPQQKGISNKIASSSLYDSIKVYSKPDEFAIEMNKYGRFVQSGRFPNDKGVPINALLQWIDDRRITPKDGNKLGLAFAIQTNIKKFGIRGSNWYDVAFEKIFENKEIEILLGKSIEELIDEIIGI